MTTFVEIYNRLKTDKEYVLSDLEANTYASQINNLLTQFSNNPNASTKEKIIDCWKILNIHSNTTKGKNNVSKVYKQINLKNFVDCTLTYTGKNDPINKS